MGINVTAIGAAGTHAFVRTNVNLTENFIYYTNTSTIPARLADGSPFLVRSGTGSLTGITSGSLYYTKFVTGYGFGLSTSKGGSLVDLTAVAAGTVSFNVPYVYNNILNVSAIFDDNQAIKYYTTGTPLTGLVSGNTYYVKSSNSGLAINSLYAFTNFTFTSAGVTGRFGPTLAQLQTAYTATAWASGNTYLQQGSYQGYQDWVVPQTGIYEFNVKGSPGRAGNGTAGGGAIVQGRISLRAGETITIVVGQRGDATGGNAWVGSGGGTFVVRKSTNTPLFVAGGGSGSSNASTGRNGVLTNNGDAAAGTAGTSGSGAPSAVAGGGGGGFLSSGGNSTYGAGGGGFNNGLIGGLGASAANSGNGGFGGAAGADGQQFGAPGGAGGYSGGAGGPGVSTTSGGGGGSYIDSAVSNVATSTGSYNGSATFNGVNITNLASYNTGAVEGSVLATLVSTGAAGFTIHPTAADSNAGTNTIAIAAAGTDQHAIVPITLDLENNTINTTAAHGLSSGDALTYRFSGAAATPLSNSVTYYVNKVNNYTYKLSTTPSPTFTDVDFTQPSSATSESFGKVIVNTATDIITIPSHGFLVNQPVNYQVSGTTLKSIASISRSGTTATATTTTNHGFATGRSIVIDGSANGDLN
jgi:hypothetical protein